MTSSEWWSGLPRWLKLVYVFLAIPAWLVIAYSVLTGGSKSALALGAFAVFVAVVILHIIFDRRRSDATESGVTFFGDDG